jgi:hypothetical protein
MKSFLREHLQTYIGHMLASQTEIRKGKRETSERHGK